MADHPVLVAYASKYGHTREIAERVAAVIEAAGLPVRLSSAADPHDLVGVRAVVLGSALYVGRWRAEAVDFLRLHRAALSDVPLFVFSSGPTGEGDLEKILEEWHLPDAVLDLLDEVGLADSVIFHGALEEGDLNLIERWVVRQAGVELGDFRDWDKIEAWAGEVAGRIAAGG